MLNGLGSDFFFALRQLRRSPGFAITAMVTLALGIGVTTAVYSLVDGVLLRPFPLPYAEQLMAVHTVEQDPGGGPWWHATSWPDYLDWRARNHTFSGMAALFADDRLVSRENGSGGVVVPLNRVSENYFDVVGVRPKMGRNFVGDDEQAGNHVAILSYGFWQRLLGGDTHAVGQTILVSDEPYTVIGVMPQGFVEPREQTAQIWTSIALLLEGSAPRAKLRDPGDAEVIGRLKPGVTQQQAIADLSAIQRALEQSYPEIRYQNAVGVRSQLEDVAGSMRPLFYLLLAAVLAVLLIVCTNVGGLMLTRAMRRRGEMALRTALGASPWRVWRQLLMESLMLGTCGGVLGAGLGWGLLRWTFSLIPRDIPRIHEVGLSWRVLCFTAGIALLSALVSGVLPAWRLTRMSPIAALREQGQHATAGRRTRWLQNTLVVVQTTLGVALLIGSGFLIRGFVNVRDAKVGFEADHLLEFNLPLTQARYPDARKPAFYHTLIPKLAAIPGVRSASAGYPLPLLGYAGWAATEIDGRVNPPEGVVGTEVGEAEPGFLETLGVPLMRGRLFTNADDNPNARLVAMVNQAFVKRFFPDRDPIGRHIRPDMRELRNQAKYIDPQGDADREIVGVIADWQQDSLIDPPEPYAVFPYAQASALMRPFLVMRVSGDPLEYVKASAAAVTSIDPALFLLSPRSMEMHLGEATGTQRFETWLIAGFSGIALFLTGVGLYSMLATMVTARTREIGVRMAIGAARGDVAWLVLVRAAMLVAAGVAAGAVVVAVALRVVNSSDWAHELLFGVSWSDPRMLLPMAAVLGAVALCGCLLPTWRAMRIDPARALRDE